MRRQKRSHYPRHGKKRSSSRGSRRTIPAAFAALVLTFAAPFPSANAQTYTWTGAGSFTNYNWSNASNWSGAAPPVGGSSSAAIAFSSNSTSNFIGSSSINDEGIFTLNSLTLNAVISNFSNFLISGGTLNFVNNGTTNPFITQSANSAFSFGTTYATVLSSLIQTDTALTINGSGTQNLTLSGTISGSGSLTIASTGNSANFGGAVVKLSGSNTYTGGTTLTSGNLSLGNSAALGTGTLTIAAPTKPSSWGGPASSLAFSATGLTVANAIVLNSDLNIIATVDGASDTFSGTISGLGSLIINGGTNNATVALTGADSFTGATVLTAAANSSLIPSQIFPRGTLTLSGNGGLTATSAVAIGSGMTLALLNSASFNLQDRIADSIPLTFNGGRLAFTGASGLASSETLGNVTVNGIGTVVATAQSASGSSSSLTLSSLNLVDKGTLFIRNSTSTSQTIGDGAPAPNRTNIYVIGGLTGISDPLGPADSQNTAIVPFLSGSLSGAAVTATNDFPSTLVAYTASNGMFVLDPNSSAYFNVVAASTSSAALLVPNVNNSITVGTTKSPLALLTGTTQINSLVYAPSIVNGTGLTIAGNPSGGAILQLYSGAIVNGAHGTSNGGRNTLTFQDLTVGFGSATGYLTGGYIALTGASAITGSGGVSVNRTNLLFTNTLTSSFTGGLFLNNSNLIYMLDSQLGAAGEKITLNGSTFSQGTDGEAVLPAARTLTIDSNGASLAASSTTGSWNIASSITGSGPLSITTGNITLSGANTYTGDMTVNAYASLNLTGTTTGNGKVIVNNYGTLQYGNVAALPSGPINMAYNSVLRPLTSDVLPNNIVLQDSINSLGFYTGAGFSPTFSGIISGSTAIDKGGAGNLTLTGVNTATGLFRLHQGSLTLTGAGSLASASEIDIFTGALLILDDTGGVAPGAGTPTHLPATLRVAGDVRWQTAPGVVAAQKMSGAMTSGLFGIGSGSLTVLPGAGGSATLTLPSTGGILYRGTNLGGSAADGIYSRIYLSQAPIGSIIVGGRADSSATGTGTSLAFYDPVVGIRTGRPSDYTTGAIIQNANPVGTPQTANIRVTGTTATAGSYNLFSSLTLAPGSTLNLTSGWLYDSSHTIFVEGGGAASTISGGSLDANYFITQGDLNISSTLTNQPDITKTGSGTLTLSGANSSIFTITVDQGIFRLATTSALSSLYSVTVADGAVFDTGTSSVSASVLSGFGNIVLGTPAPGGSSLTITSSGNYYGTISGTGSLNLSSGYLHGANTYSGGTIGSHFLVGTPTSLGSGAVQFNNTSGGADVTFRQIGTSTVGNNFILSGTGGQTTQFNVSNTNPAYDNTVGETFADSTYAQEVTLSGKISGGSSAANTVLALSSSGGSAVKLTNTANDFLATVQVQGGILAIISDGVLGNSANNLLLSNSSTLRLDSPNVAISRNLSLNSGIIDTNGNNATVRGVVSGTSTTSTFVKAGAGTLTLSNSGNTFVGSTTVSAGALSIIGVLGTTASTNSVTVYSDATLEGNGKILGGTTTAGAIVLNGGGIIAPGVDGSTIPSILTASSLVALDGAKFDFDLDLSSAASDQLDLAAFFSRSSPGTFTFDFTTTGTLVAASQTYTLVKFASTNFSGSGGTGRGDFGYTGLPSGLTGSFQYNPNSLTFVVSHDANTPEPGSLLLATSGLVLLCGSRKQRLRHRYSFDSGLSHR